MKKKLVITAACATLVLGTALYLRSVTLAPARAAARNLASINGLTVGKTTEAEFLTRPEFQTVEPLCVYGDCLYDAYAENTFLYRMHLAPRTGLSTMVKVHAGMVVGVTVLEVRDGLPSLWIKQVPVMASDCSASPCVRRQVLPGKTLIGTSIEFGNDSPLRNHLPEFVNSACLSRIGGCDSYAELMPIARELNIDAAK